MPYSPFRAHHPSIPPRIPHSPHFYPVHSAERDNVVLPGFVSVDKYSNSMTIFICINIVVCCASRHTRLFSLYTSGYVLAEYLWTHSKKNRKSSGSTPGVIPCPRFAIQPLGGLPSLKLTHILFTSLSIASRPPYSTFGSRLPCNATLDPTSLRASEASMHQSRPRTS